MAEDFAAQNADFDFTVDGPGTGDGFALFCNGETDISDASRPTYDSFLEIVFGDIAEARETDEVARPDYTASADDNVIIEGIGGTATSLGWVGFAFYEENADAVKAIEVDGGDGCVAPTAETISSNEYPISRDLFIYVNTDAAAENESVSAFVDYFLSDEGMAAVDEAGYVSLTAELLDETRAAWEGR